MRVTFAQVSGRPAPFYGVVSALGMAVPLLVGTLTGHGAEGATAALGAYLIALTAPTGPYGARARSLAITTAVVASAAAVGGALVGHPRPAAALVPGIVAIGAGVPWLGATGGLAVLLTAVRPVTGSVVYTGFLELVGALLVSLLLLLPWPAQRLRPMRQALSDAAEAVAAALDTVAQHLGRPDLSPLEAVHLTDPGLAALTRESDWERQRRAAAEALGAARNTYSLYRADRDTDRRPERLINALSRVMHDTVTLHAQLAELAGSPVAGRRAWERDARVAVTALAARIRLLAGAVAHSAVMPLWSDDSRAVHRMARQSDRIWRADHETEAELVDAALVSQVRRTIDRIAGTVDFSRRLMADGLRIGVLFPGLPTLSRDSVRHLCRRVVSGVRTRSPMFRHITRVWLLVTVAMVATAAFAVPHAHWLTATVMFSVRGTYGETVQDAMQRSGGTTLGAALAAVVLAASPNGNAIAVLLLFACGVVGFTLRPLSQAYWAVFGTPLVLMLLDFSVPAGWADAGSRIALTVAGGLLAVAGTRLLWPAGSAQILPDRLGQMLSAHADLARAAAEVLDRDRETLPPELLERTLRSTAEVAAVRTRLTDEPVPPDALIGRLGTAVRCAHRVRDGLIAVSQSMPDADAGPAADIVERVADLLAETADIAAAAGPAKPAPPELDTRFADLDKHLSALVRQRRAEEPDVTETTPVRRALLAAAGLRHALRNLAGDAEELTSEVLASRT